MNYLLTILRIVKINSFLLFHHFKFDVGGTQYALYLHFDNAIKSCYYFKLKLLLREDEQFKNNNTKFLHL